MEIVSTRKMLLDNRGIRMAIEIKKEPEILVVQPDNLLNPMDNQRAVDLIEEYILDGHNRILIDLEQVEFFPSSGLNFLLSLLTKSRNNEGETVIINISEQASKTLIVTKLKDLFTVAESKDAAIELLTAEV